MPFLDSLKFLDGSLTVKGTSSSINLGEVSQLKKKRIPNGEIKEELKIEIWQCILNAKRRAPKSKLRNIDSTVL